MNLHQIKIYQEFCKEASHSVDIRNMRQNNFIPTKFIYAMITFNIIYENFYREHPLPNDKVYVNDKIKVLVDKIFNDIKLEELYNTLKIDTLEIDIFKRIRNDSSINKKIKLDDKELDISYKDVFLESFNFIKKNKKIQKEELLRILLFINRIRNNFFHGSKSLYDILNNVNHNERLNVYTDIILAVNEICIKELKIGGY
ncbi:hypothetical protein [Fusobacterium mortiferum]|uniref:hypothetical protein n=1 Tax=Fusobacterium mortiferum TaxID=850 RepID=UPI0022E96806|nr:hypothetical protein [Fusobacterium mortiferum]